MADDENPVYGAIMYRIGRTHPEWISKYGLKAIEDCVQQTAEFVGDVEEIGSSDVSAWVNSVQRMLERIGPLPHMEGFRPQSFKSFMVEAKKAKDKKKDLKKGKKPAPKKSVKEEDDDKDDKKTAPKKGADKKKGFQSKDKDSDKGNDRGKAAKVIINPTTDDIMDESKQKKR